MVATATCNLCQDVGDVGARRGGAGRKGDCYDPSLLAALVRCSTLFLVRARMPWHTMHADDTLCIICILASTNRSSSSSSSSIDTSCMDMHIMYTYTVSYY